MVILKGKGHQEQKNVKKFLENLEKLNNKPSKIDLTTTERKLLDKVKKAEGQPTKQDYMFGKWIE